MFNSVMRAKMPETAEIINNTEFICSFLYFESGRNLIKPVFKPSKLNVAIKFTIEDREVARPI